MWANLSVSLVRVADGQPKFFIAVIEDITARKQAEDALTKANELLEATVRERTAHLALLQQVTAAANESTHWEDAAQLCLDQVCRSTGWPVGHIYVSGSSQPGELVSTDIWHIEDEARFQPFKAASAHINIKNNLSLPARTCVAKRAVWIPDVVNDAGFLRRDAAIATGLKSAFAFPAMIADKVVAILEFFTDAIAAPDLELLDVMTQVGTQLGRAIERKQADDTRTQQAKELTRSNTELEQFAYVISHALREPLRMITNFSQLLDKKYKSHLDAAADKYLHYIVDGVARMDNLTTDLLSYSRVGRESISNASLNLNAVINNALKNLTAAIDESHAQIIVDPLPQIHGDHLLLLQLFQNLLSNALKFRRPNTAPVIKVSAMQHDGEIIFSVADNGIGIDTANAERIFVIFQRLHSRSEYPGTGIGLAICKKIVEQHGGRIWIESHPEHGTTFFFTLAKSHEKSWAQFTLRAS